jgi:hypothetical protein
MEVMFNKSTDAQIFHHLVTDNRRPKLSEDVPDVLRSIITLAWDSDSTLRPSAEELTKVLEGLYADELADL